jgi:predicted nucleotidyltransferase
VYANNTLVEKLFEITFMLTSNEIINFLRENKTVFQTRFHCTKVGLFGSFARGEQTEESDIDLIVQYENDVPDLYTNEQEMKDFVSTRFGKKVDVCAEKWVKPVFKQ